MTANEGDSRDYTGYDEEAWVEDVTSTRASSRPRTLRQDENIGRL